MKTDTFIYLFVAIVVIGVIGQLYFLFGSHTPAKRRWYPWWVVALTVMFALAPLAGRMPWSVAAFWWPAVILNGFFLIRTTRFCDACGAMRASPWRNNFCPRCGAPLAKPRVPSGSAESRR
ncbi:MAG TPA: hypothetical protein VFU01_12485 [Gemmatimonadaceae bacterium]|nr:hypothetical protein [Gemmatimonadaceae bacterium]